MNNIIKNIEELSKLFGVSSREFEVSDYIKNELKNYSYEFCQDNVGNLIVKKSNQDKDLKKLLIFAHMDEIGIVIRKITDEGFLYFERIGGVNTQILPGTKFIFKTKKGYVVGVVGVMSHHFMPQENKFVVPSVNKLYIDIFVGSKTEVKDLGIDVGTFGVYYADFIKTEEFITGKALDNRVAVAILINLIKYFENKELKFDTVFCFPVMEEFNIRGIMPVIRKIKPDISIGLDVTPSCDTPDMSYNEISLGNGPALTYMNFHGRGTLAGVLSDAKLLENFEEIALKNNINIQKEVAPGVITENAFAVFENDEGIKTIGISIPTRYTHTPFETISIKDVLNTFTLLKMYLEK